MNKINIDINELSEKYESGLSASFLAKYYGVSVWAIITRLRKFGIEIRKNIAEKYIFKTVTTICSLPEAKRAELVDNLQEEFDTLNGAVELINQTVTLSV